MAIAVAFTAAPALAQTAPQPASAPATRPMIVDGAITVAMVGLGLFVVCRGGKRN